MGFKLSPLFENQVCLWHFCTGRFIMLSVITNIYNKKTKAPTLMKLFTATGILKKFVLATTEVRCVHHRWHGTHRYDIQVLATHTHASTWVHRYSSLLQWSMPLGQRGHVGGSFVYFARNARCTVTTDLLVWYSNTQNDFSPGATICSLHTLASPSGRNVNYNEKQLTGEKIWNENQLMSLFYSYIAGSLHVSGPQAHLKESSYSCSHSHWFSFCTALFACCVCCGLSWW